MSLINFNGRRMTQSPNVRPAYRAILDQGNYFAKDLISYIMDREFVGDYQKETRGTINNPTGPSGVCMEANADSQNHSVIGNVADIDWDPHTIACCLHYDREPAKHRYPCGFFTGSIGLGIKLVNASNEWCNFYGNAEFSAGERLSDVGLYKDYSLCATRNGTNTLSLYRDGVLQNTHSSVYAKDTGTGNKFVACNLQDSATAAFSAAVPVYFAAVWNTHHDAFAVNSFQQDQYQVIKPARTRSVTSVLFGDQPRRMLGKYNNSIDPESTNMGVLLRL